MMNDWRNEFGQAALNQYLSSMGFSSVAAYVDHIVNDVFANETKDYSFSTDGTALFLEEALPANKGTNEFTGQTYYGVTWEGDGDDIKSVKDENKKYVFTASGYTFTMYSETITGSYAYDSTQKWVWLKPEKIDGKDRAAYYAVQTAYPGHHYPDDNADRAARTDQEFNNKGGSSQYVRFYDSTNKTIIN
jgi:hypothetical protein